MDDALVKEYLVEKDEAFRKLAEEHQEYERRLEELVEKPFLSDQDHFQELQLKKKKLALKDQMQMLISQHRQELSAE